MNKLTTKYRPKTIAEIAGNSELKRDLIGFLKQKPEEWYLIIGKPGTAKSVSAEIIAHSYQCQGVQPLGYEPCGKCDYCEHWVKGEISRLRFSGDYIIQYSAAAYKAPKEAAIEIQKDLKDLLGPMIIDEVDQIRGNEKRLLSLMADAPRYPVIFTTTDVDRLDYQFLSRCIKLYSKPLKDDEMTEFLRKISRSEGYEITDAEIRQLKKELGDYDAKGQARDALNILQRLLVVRKMA